MRREGSGGHKFGAPFVELLITIPPPAVIPLVMLFAGVGDNAKIAVVFYACAPLILVNTMEGARNTPPMLEQVARSLIFASQSDGSSLIAGDNAGHHRIRLAIATSLLVSVTSENSWLQTGLELFFSVARKASSSLLDSVRSQQSQLQACA